jgi:hypothetical protein
MSLLFTALLGTSFSQSVTFNVTGSNPRCQSQFPNGAPYSGLAQAPAGAQSLVDVTFTVQVQNGASWSLWGSSFVRVSSGSYSNNSSGAPQLTMTPVNVIRMRAVIRYRNVVNGPILTATAFSSTVQYNYFPAPSIPAVSINGQAVAPPPVVTPFYTCTGDAMLQTMGLANISGTGVQWRLNISYTMPGSTISIPSDVNNCPWVSGPPPLAGINVTTPEENAAFGECPIRPHVFTPGELMTVTLQVQNDCGTTSQTIVLQIFDQPSGATVNFYFRGSNLADGYSAQGANNQTPTGEQNPATNTASQTDGVLSWGGTDANPTWVGASQTTLDVSGTSFYGGVQSWTVEIFVKNSSNQYVPAGSYSDPTPGNTQINIQNVPMSINGGALTAGYFSANFNSSSTGVLGKQFKVRLTGKGVCDQQPTKEGYFRITPDQPWWIVGGDDPGTPDIAASESLQVVPNPVGGANAKLEVYAAEDAEAMLRVVGTNGQAVKLGASPHISLTKGHNSFMLDIGHLPPGIYAVQVLGQGMLSSTNLIKL